MHLKHKIIIVITGATIIAAVQFWLPMFSFEQSDSLPLSCTAIPASTESICTVVTESPMGPYDDVDIYHQIGNGIRILLSHNTGGVSTFGGFGFSANGKYMWVSWADEGHPYFNFYRTALYLVNGSDGESFETLDDYYFDEIKAFTNKGEFIYSHTNNDDQNNCQDISKYISAQVVPDNEKPNTMPTPCYKVILLQKV